jgi:hypothetical protein
LIGFVCFYSKFYDEIAFPMKRLRPPGNKTRKLSNNNNSGFIVKYL